MAERFISLINRAHRGQQTLSGFLPSLIDLTTKSHGGIHTLYVSPLKALATDIERNLETPVNEMGLSNPIETRTGDTPQSKRNHQEQSPPDILLTTPESLELMLGWPDADRVFGDLKTIIIDEIHTTAGSKRGDLLGLSLAKLRTLPLNVASSVYQQQWLTQSGLPPYYHLPLKRLWCLSLP